MIYSDILEKLEKIQKITFDEARAGNEVMATINNLAHECKKLIIRKENLTDD